MTHTASPRDEFIRGIKESSPMLIGLLPWALILGMQAGKKVYSAGNAADDGDELRFTASEFATVNLWATSADTAYRHHNLYD